MMLCRKFWKFLRNGDQLQLVNYMTCLSGSCLWSRCSTLSFRCKIQDYPFSITRFLLQSRQGSSQLQKKAFSSECRVWRLGCLDTRLSLDPRQVCPPQSKLGFLDPKRPDGLSSKKRSWCQTIWSVLQPVVPCLRSFFISTITRRQMVRSWAEKIADNTCSKGQGHAHEEAPHYWHWMTSQRQLALFLGISSLEIGFKVVI